MHEIQASPPLEPEPEQYQLNYDAEPEISKTENPVKTICENIDILTKDATKHSTNHRRRCNLSSDIVKNTRNTADLSEPTALASALEFITQMQLADIYGDIRFTFTKFSHDLGHKALSSLLVSDKNDGRDSGITVDAFEKIDADGGQRVNTSHYLLSKDKQDNYTIEKIIYSRTGGEGRVYLTDEEAQSVLAVVREVVSPKQDNPPTLASSASVA